MAINYPGPYEVRIFYHTNEAAAIADHVLRLSCNMNVVASPGDPFSSWSATKRDGTGVVLSTAVDALIVLVKPFFHSSTDFIYAELWEYTPSSFDAIFRSSYTIGVSGTSASVTVSAAQTVVSFRTATGGIFKVDMRGTISNPAIGISFPTAITIVDNLAAHLVGASSPWIGRDNGYPLSPIRYLPGQNERAWRIVNR